MHTYLDDNEPVTTMHEYVTGTPLTEDEKFTPDEHGNYPVSPLGFPNHNVSGYDPSTPTENCPRTAVGTFGVGYGNGVPANYAEAYKIATNYSLLYGQTVRFSVSSLSSVKTDGTVTAYTVTVSGDIRDTVTEARTSITGHFVNAAEDDFSNTKILHTNFSINWGTSGNCTYDEMSGESTIVIPKSDLAESKVTGSISSGKLVIVLENTIQYVYLYGQTDSSENGLYGVANSSYDNWNKMSNYDHRAIAITDKEDFADPEKYPYADASVNDNVSGHSRKGYSDREVADAVNASVGEIISAAVHPSSVAGELTGAGALTTWFASSGKVDITGGAGAHAIMVNGFGLGNGYNSEPPYREEYNEHYRYDSNGNKISYTVSKSDDTLKPVIEFGYGTKHTATYAGTGDAALPQDWPFTGISEYKGREFNNNITLIKDSVKLKGTNTDVGGLERDEWDDCPKCSGLGTVQCPTCKGAGGTCETCGGTGVVECEACNGTGTSNVRHLLMNRMNLCLFNDFEPSNDENGHTDGSTVLKKTFVHLATPLDTEDGDEYEITVSLPTTNIDMGFPGNDKTMDRSGYYAYISQPRVYVMSGSWKFSSTKVHVVDPCNDDYKTVDGYFKIGTDSGFYNAANELLPEGTAVRVKLDGGSNYPRYNVFLGTLIYNQKNSAILKLKGAFPYDVGGRHWFAGSMSICGLAYLDTVEDEQDKLGNLTNTSLGIHTRNAATLSKDFGEGAEGDLNAYNRFFTAETSEGRDTLIPDSDNRYLIATVYPTVTNTFGWSLASRRKLSHLDRLMTTEADSGRYSITEAAWQMNHDIIAKDELQSAVANADGSYKLTPDAHPLGYSSMNIIGSSYVIGGGDGSAIAAQLKVHLPDNISECYQGETGNPVRQAIRAYRALLGDFYRIRMNYSFNDEIGLNDSSKLRYSTATVESLEDISFDEAKSFKAAGMETSNPASEFWRMKVRHLPEYIRTVGQDTTSTINQSPCGWKAFSDKTLATYYGRNIYGYTGFYSSTDAIEDSTCELIGAPGLERMYADRSVITALSAVDANITSNAKYDDILRYAETQVIDLANYSSFYNDAQIATPARHKYGSSEEFPMRLEAFHPFTKIFSLDTIPFPKGVEYIGTAYKDAKQRPFISGDAIASYRYEAEDDGVDDQFEFISTTLPTSTALANFVKEFIPCYAAQMPIRFWDGTRVAIAQNGIPDKTTGTGKRVYLTRMKWYDAMLDDCSNADELRSQYINDTLISRSNGSQPIDDNMSWITFTDDTDEQTEIDGNWSAPPHTVDEAFYDDSRIGDKVGYVRVYMKFKFSADAGRWYTVDYRQAPVAYLSPLYGAEALEARMDSVITDGKKPANITIDGMQATSDATQKIWVNSMCTPAGGWQAVLMHPYYDYCPMDINLGVLPFLLSEYPYDEGGDLLYPEYNTEDGIGLYFKKLVFAHLPVGNGGIGLYPPATVNGSYNADTYKGIHANFWSVREHLRPAVACLANTDVPQFYYDSNKDAIANRTGGVIGDSTLWGQFSYPRKGIVDYHLPSPYNPYADMTKNYVTYSDGSGSTGNLLAANSTVLSFYNNSEHAVEVLETVPTVAETMQSISNSIGPVEGLTLEQDDTTVVATWSYSGTDVLGYKVIDSDGKTVATLTEGTYTFNRGGNTETYYIAPYAVEACVDTIGEQTAVTVPAVSLSTIVLTTPTDGIYYGLNWTYGGIADRYVVTYGERSYEVPFGTNTLNLKRNNETALTGVIYPVLNGKIGVSVAFTVPALHKIVPSLKSEDNNTATWQWSNTNVNHIDGYEILGLNESGEWIVLDTIAADTTEYTFTKDGEIEKYKIHPLTYVDYSLIDSDIINVTTCTIEPVELTDSNDSVTYTQEWTHNGT